MQQVYKNFDITVGTPIALFMNPADFFVNRRTERVQLDETLWLSLPPPIRTPFLEVRLQRDIDNLRKRGLDLWEEWDCRLQQHSTDDFHIGGELLVTLYAGLAGPLGFCVSPDIRAFDLLPPVASKLGVTVEDLVMYHQNKIVLPGQTLRQLGARTNDHFVVSRRPK